MCRVSSLAHCMPREGEDRTGALLISPVKFKSSSEMVETLVVEISHLTLPMQVIFFKWLFSKLGFDCKCFYAIDSLSCDSEPVLNCSKKKSILYGTSFNSVFLRLFL